MNNKTHLFENHDESLYIWERESIKSATLIHVDAHHDLYGVWESNTDNRGSDTPINIGNYLFKAIEKNIINKMIWVLPDQTFVDSAGVDAIFKKLGSISGAYQFRMLEEKIISGCIFGVPLIACTLDNIPESNTNVLLDIDVDFLLVKDATNLKEINFEKKPWIDPIKLLKKLKNYNFQYDIVTIAYSVNGGYTPLQWKHLGKEIKALLLDVDLIWPSYLKRAADFAQIGMYSDSLEQCRIAEKLAPEEGSIQYYFSRINWALGNTSEALSRFSKATLLDRTYSSPFGASGWACIEFGRLDEARCSFLNLICLNPKEPYFFLGLGIVYSRIGYCAEPVILLKTAISFDPTIIECYRELGDIYMNQNRYADAMNMLIASLLLFKIGYKPKTDPNMIGRDPSCRNECWDYSSIETREKIQIARSKLKMNMLRYYLNKLKIMSKLAYSLFLFFCTKKKYEYHGGFTCGTRNKLWEKVQTLTKYNHSDCIGSPIMKLWA